MGHPFHPWRGWRFELVAYKSAWGEDRVYFHNDEQQLVALPASWTDVAAAGTTGHTDSVLSVALRPDGKRLATASWDQMVKVWDTGSGQELVTLERHRDIVNGVAKRLPSALHAR